MTSSIEFHTGGQDAYSVAGATIGNILVVVDPMASSPACIDKAARLAMKCGAHLELFVCDTEPDCPESLRSALSVWDYRRHLRIRRLHLLETLATPLRLAGLTVHTSATWSDSLAGGVVALVNHVFADLVVKDRDDTEATQCLLSEADAILTKQLSGPLLLVDAHAWPESPKIDVAIGILGERSDELLIARARSLAEHLGGELDLSNRQRPAIVVLGVPSNPSWTDVVSAHTLTRLRHCDLLLMKAPCQTQPYGTDALFPTDRMTWRVES